MAKRKKAVKYLFNPAKKLYNVYKGKGYSVKGKEMTNKIVSYKDLIVWQKSMELVKEIYKLTEKFSKDEQFGLKSQMERASVSIPSQIAEGYMRKHNKEYTHFLSIALGSSAELDTQIIICKSLDKFKLLDFSKAEKLLQEVIKMLYVMIEKIKGRDKG